MIVRRSWRTSVRLPRVPPVIHVSCLGFCFCLCICPYIFNFYLCFYLYILVKEDIGETATTPLRHSCQLSEDKNRTKQNQESGKCRLSLPISFLLHLHLKRWSANTSAVISAIVTLPFFRTSKSEICWQELCTGWPGPRRQPHTRFPIFSTTAITNRQ